MKYVINILIILIFSSYRSNVDIIYTSELPQITISNLSCKTEDNINQLAALVASEAMSEPLIGKHLIIESVLDRVESNQFPNTIDSVIFQRRQYDGIKTKYFKVNNSLYELTKDYYMNYIPNDTLKLFYYNPKVATNSKFINWCKSKYKYKKLYNHTFHYKITKNE